MTDAISVGSTEYKRLLRRQQEILRQMRTSPPLPPWTRKELDETEAKLTAAELAGRNGYNEDERVLIGYAGG